MCKNTKETKNYLGFYCSTFIDIRVSTYKKEGERERERERVNNNKKRRGKCGLAASLIFLTHFRDCDMLPVMHDFTWFWPMECDFRWFWWEGWFVILWLVTCDMGFKVIVKVVIWWNGKLMWPHAVTCDFRWSWREVLMTLPCYLWCVVPGDPDNAEERGGSSGCNWIPVTCWFRCSWQMRGTVTCYLWDVVSGVPWHWWFTWLWLVTCDMWFQVFLTLTVHETVPCFLLCVVSDDPDSGDERDYDLLPVRCGFRCSWHWWFTWLCLVTCNMWFHMILTVVMRGTMMCYLWDVVSGVSDTGGSQDCDLLPVTCGFMCFWHWWLTWLWLVSCGIWFQEWLWLVTCDVFQVILTVVMGGVVHVTGTVISYMVTAGAFGLLACFFIQNIVVCEEDMVQFTRASSWLLPGGWRT